MSFSQILAITTIDEPDTRRREDGFCIDPSSGTIHLTSIVPPFEKVSFDEVKYCIGVGILECEKNGFQLFAKKPLGFTSDTPRKSLVVKMAPPYEKAEVGISTAVIEQQLTYEEANRQMRLNQTLIKIQKYIQDVYGHPMKAEDLVYHLGFTMNNAYMDAMKACGVPFLGYVSATHSIFTNKGFPLVSKPLRNPVALINCLQLVTLLTTGAGFFCKEELLMMTGGTE